MRSRAMMVFLLASAACGPAASPDSGLHLMLRVAGAQLVEGPLPADEGGPPITLVEVPNRRVRAGEAGYALRGRAGEGSHALRVGLEADPDHWLFPVAFPDDVNPLERNWSAALAFAANIPVGAQTVLVSAADADGRPGALQRVDFQVLQTVTSTLQVTLRWDRQADVDLHVVDPSGVDINAKNINSYTPPAPGQPPAPPDAWRTGALLDHDSNAGCLIAGRRQENVSWPAAPPTGNYVVYVDLFSACGEPSANFEVTVSLRGAVIAHARGSLYPSDARTHPLAPGAAPGLRAVEFSVGD